MLHAPANLYHRKHRDNSFGIPLVVKASGKRRYHPRQARDKIADNGNVIKLCNKPQTNMNHVLKYTRKNENVYINNNNKATTIINKVNSKQRRCFFWGRAELLYKPGRGRQVVLVNRGRLDLIGRVPSHG